MPKYRVMIPEVHYLVCDVEAATPEEAREIALSGEADGDLQYSHTLLDSNEFSVREIKEE